MRMNQIIAITLIVVVAAPIALGYGLAFDEVERTGWKSTESANLSGLILNSETEYYNVSTVPGNNSQLTGTESDLSVPEIFAPGYNDVSGTASSLPMYTTEEITTTCPTQTYTLTGADHSVAFIGGYGVIKWFIPYTTSELTFIDSNGQYFTMGAGDPMALYFDGTNYVSPQGYVLSEGVDIRIYSNPNNVSFNVTYTEYVTVPTSYDWSTFGAYKFDSNGQTVYGYASSIYYLSGMIVADGVPYEDVTNVYLACATINYNVLTLTRTVQVPGSYADPAAGWNVTSMPELKERLFWLNGQVNQSVQFLVRLPIGEVTFSALQGTESGPELSVFRDLDDMIIVSVGSDSYTLGKYEYLQVIVSTKGFEVSGLAGWPTMYAPATKINTWSHVFDTPLDDFLRVELFTNPAASYRVDSAVIVAGTYPVSEDFALDVSQYWPGASWALRFPNVGVYGSALTFGGIEYPIVNGQITFNTANGGTTTASPLGLLFQATYDSGVWTYSINGHEQATAEAALPMVFDGIWSLSVEGYKVEKVTTTTLEWVPGEFGLDNTDFILVALGACGMVFVGLGLYGQRSGHKMLMLAVICGIVALVLWFML